MFTGYFVPTWRMSESHPKQKRAKNRAHKFKNASLPLLRHLQPQQDIMKVQAHQEESPDIDPRDYLPDYKAPEPPTRQRSCVKRSLCAGFVLAIAAVAVVAILMAFSGEGGPKSIFVMEDPPGLNETHAWETFGDNGLDITVLNALDDRWTSIFDASILDWDNGQPDALTLSTRKVAVDPDCSPVDGRIKVCNGDYGATDWRGINTAFLQNGFIVHSAAKLNDYHLQGGSQAQKEYTMCHELGHAFGLPHTDTNYYNMDRGDCLDYTMRPRLNLKPGEFNFNLLYKVYGPANPENQAQRNNDGRRQRRLGTPVIDNETPNEIAEKYKSVVDCLTSKTCFECEGESIFDEYSLIHDSDEGEACEFTLGEGYTARVDKLLVA